MNKIINSTYLRRAGTFCAGFALTVAAFCGGSMTAFAGEQRNIIANRIMQLQQSSQRWIEIDLSRQKLIAWEGNKPVYAVTISSGKSSTPTRTGTFAIQTKHRVTRMTGDDYDVPDVPYTMYYDGGNAIHGAYWHNLFGNPVTHGCTNVAVNHAKWLFNWASVGTAVVVHKSEI
ncbi:MAG: L,D-transpeptidase [Microcoleus sp. PH2017_10_PVI_O_A]|uniref:L,D-transpeptidase n=1 Tax=unclassified Microcoleus TaxID=2642155 RepID=UPI001D515D31|nr:MULTISPECIES: L,D-transpeptidase [unclassified Microcoleus]TAE85969.1 MAG: L,D-transpeptidase [Oscillatoriales cyanobacterium]MCC3404031.1 L,D-transpeptidase [Microcoleus sp. PH2017_10_PVI_O_A]MCC3458114.1 L,D-transpeptidase [Microcoleus sp. PH2017_11_PCY_U_A]MCC3476536.1 L,D-transpeptidase [Microcoleus sp. PH2017_12_PCY_D_A]MCC3527123.1 L,D-transpeptidase [Microcoleus sp. PH2017_21_RUC_O_A]